MSNLRTSQIAPDRDELQHSAQIILLMLLQSMPAMPGSIEGRMVMTLERPWVLACPGLLQILATKP